MDKTKLSKGRRSLFLFIFGLTLPAMILLLGFLVYPIGSAVYMAFHKVGLAELGSRKMPFVGVENFTQILKDDLFKTSFKNTLLFAGATVSLQILLGLALALVVTTRSPLSPIIKGIMLLPWAIPPIVNGILWNFLFDSTFGHINVLLKHLGIIESFVMWLSDPKLALLAVIIANVWRSTPFCAILFYASLQMIPRKFYEVAKVNGASSWDSFWYITLPLVKSTMAILLVLRTIFSLRVFAEIFSMTYGGPGNATWVLGWYTYSQAFNYFRYGVGSASGLILALLTAAITLVYLKFLYREVEY